MLILVMALDQAVAGDTRGKVMDMVVANVGGEEVQPARQYQETGAFDGARIVVPALTSGRVGMLKGVLHSEQHDSQAARDRHGEHIDDEEQRRTEIPAHE